MYGKSIPCQGNSPVQLGGMGRLGCPGCNGTCGQRSGLGLFEAGLDFSQWSLTEWALAVGGAYVAASVIGDLMSIGRGVKYAAGAPGRGYRRVKAGVSAMKAPGKKKKP